MEVALEADDLRALDAAPVGVLAGDLDRALVGLGPRVGEEDPARPGSTPRAARPAAPSARCRRGWRRASAGRPARARPRPRPGGSGRPSRPRSRRGSRGTPCPRSPRAASPRRARTRPAPAGRSASGSAAPAPAAPPGVHEVTMVPMPASVKSSSRRLCGLRPSMMWADWAPPRIASTQAAELRPHAAVDPVQPRLDLADRGARDQRALVGRVGEPAVDVGEEDRLVGAERGGDLAGGLVGVDVVGAGPRGRRPRRRSPGCSRRRCG